MQAEKLGTVGMTLAKGAALVGCLLLSTAVAAQRHGDFDGDGYDDLAIGVPFEDVGHVHDAGAVNVIYGLGGFGLDAFGNQFWEQNDDGLQGTSEEDDRFGSSLAVCDFDGDGYDDLAIGHPGETVGAVLEAGAVTVLYGTAGALSSAFTQVFTQADGGITDVAEIFDHFGRALACGDINHDGYADLAIGVPGEDIDGVEDAGAVHALYGSVLGLVTLDEQFWFQDDPLVPGIPEFGDEFGYALAIGDFNDDDFEDLAVGVPGDNVGIRWHAGAVNILYGDWPGLTFEGAQIFHQDIPGIKARAEDGDGFGYALAIGDFNDDLFDDLAVGVPYEDLRQVPYKIYDPGAVHVFYGDHDGLLVAGNSFWHQNIVGMPEKAENNDHFGFALAAGDFDGDDYDDLAIGVGHESVGSVEGAGSVHVLFGSAACIVVDGNQYLHQGTPGVESIPERWDQFGFSLTTGNFDGDAYDDLAVGVFHEGIGPIHGAGATHAFYGFSGGLATSGSQLWHQNSPGILNRAEKFDGFGAAVRSAGR